eukprot:Em0003g238a
MHTARSVISGGEPSALLESEVLTLNDEEKKSLLEKAGITNVSIGPAEVLAIKTGLAIPWNRLRLLRRWLKASGVSLAGEERMCYIRRRIVGNNLKEERWFYFHFHPLLVVVELLEENQRTGWLTWHDGVIPASEIWLKLGRDKGGGSFKMLPRLTQFTTPACFAALKRTTHCATASSMQSCADQPYTDGYH